jgi:ATP-dependent Clp protease ATP-binding subunit ClpC
MARGALQLIGATTLEEYRKYIEKDAALERRFQPVDVPEPSEKECVEILRGLTGKYEEHHGCIYTEDALKAAVYMSKRYIADRFLPDKAIDVIDEAGARLRLRHDSPEMGEKGKALTKELGEVKKKKESAAKAEDFLKAQELFEREAELQALIELEKKNNRELSEAAQWAGLVSAVPIVTESDVAQVIAAVSGVPVDKVSASEGSSLMNLESEMREMMVGQNDAVEAISQAIRRARTGMRDPSRPIGSFIFAGPTGVGKSQLAKALCTSYFGSEDNMVRLDMSEYMEKHTVSKLIGSPPGYVGYDEGGGLTEKIRRSPYTLVLFDEVEKAHKDVFNLMLQILDDGRLTDAKGRTVDFKNTMVIMTTNIGSDVIMKQSKEEEAAHASGAAHDDEEVDEEAYRAMKMGVDDELKKFFRPEFLNRLDGIIVFHKLTRGNVREIAEIFLKKTYKRMKEKNVTLEITPAFKERLVEMGYNPTYGARPLRRAMSTMIEDQLAEVVLRGEMKEGDSVTMDMLGHDKIIVYNQEGELLYTKDVSAGNFGIS